MSQELAHFRPGLSRRVGFWVLVALALTGAYGLVRRLAGAMTVRELKPSDLPALAAIDSEPDPLPELTDPMTEAALVVLDDEGNPMMACLAQRTVQMYLVASKKEKPLEGSRHLRLLQNTMASLLKRKGYSEAFAFVSSPRFGRVLEDRFGWLQTKLSWMKRL